MNIYSRTCIGVGCIQNSPFYAILFVGLAILGLGSLIFEFTPFATPELVLISGRLDFVIACIFFTDFLFGMFFNNNGLSYVKYIRKNWIDLLASIPLSYDMARVLRILRIFKALRILSASLDFIISESRFKALRNKK